MIDGGGGGGAVPATVTSVRAHTTTPAGLKTSAIDHATSSTRDAGLVTAVSHQ